MRNAKKCKQWEHACLSFRRMRWNYCLICLVKYLQTVYKMIYESEVCVFTLSFFISFLLRRYYIFFQHSLRNLIKNYIILQCQPYRQLRFMQACADYLIITFCLYVRVSVSGLESISEHHARACVCIHTTGLWNIERIRRNLKYIYAKR